jgi:S1-C subfamily serine protease
MVRVLLVFLSLLVAPSPRPADAAPADLLLEAFDPAPLTVAERRLVQAALAGAGDYAGALDGDWTAAAGGALAAYAGREFGEAPLNLHAATLLFGFAEQVADGGWDMRYLPDLGISLALPLDRLGPAEPEDGGERRWSRDGALTVLTHRFDAAGARAWHAAARAAGTAGVTAFAAPDLLVTAGTLRDGRGFHTRSDRTGTHWATVYLAGGPGDAASLALAAGSIRPGPPLPWDLPAHGRLARIVAATEAWVANGHGLAVPAAADARTTGTAFYLGARTLVTAAHVVAGCGRVTLADGTGLALIAADPDLDIAALAAPRPGPAWLALADRARARLGQRVHAAAFPYYSIAGTSLHLTGGNVSALAGIDDDRRFFSFTAPVQPGNSGGPLLDSHGRVLGLVVARLSQDYIVQETGSRPQNVNYALSEAELAAYLERRADPRRDGPGPQPDCDMDDGAPDALTAAVVPIVCH